MATFEEQVNGLTNLSISGTSTDPGQTELSTFLKDGVVDVTSRCLAVKPQDSFMFMRISSESTSQAGVSAPSAKVISVIRESGTNDDWRECRRIPASFQGRVVDTASLYYASAYNPVYFISEEGAILVYPAPSSGGANSYKVHYVNGTPTDQTNNATLTHAHSDIKYFPEDKVYLVVLYAAIQSLQAALSAKSLPDAVTIPVLPAFITLSTVSTSLPTFTSPSGFVSPASLADADVSFSEVGSFPSFVKPAFSAPSLGSVASLTLPSIPVAPTLTDNSISFSTSVPTYNQPVLSLGATPTISDLTISAVPPVPPESPRFTDPTIQAITVGTMPDIDFTLLSNVGTAPTYTSPVVGGATEELTATIDAATAGEATDKYDFSRWFDLAADYIENEEDVELAQAQIQKISTYLNSYSAAMQNQLNIFNDANAEYQAKLQESIQQAQLNSQRAIQQAQIDSQKVTQQSQIDAQDAQQEAALLLQKQNQEYALKLQKYSAEVSEYQAEVSKEVQEYQQNMTGDLQVWNQERQTDIQKHSADIQNALNTFNKENVEYQAQLQISMQNAQLSSKDDANALQKYSSETAVYQAEVNSKLQEWINEEWNQNFLKYQTDYGQLLQEYGSDIQAETQRIQNEAQDYQQKVGKALQTYQAETGYDVSKLNADIQKEVQRFTHDLAKQNASYQSDLSKYQAESGKINQDNQSKVAKFTAEVQSFANELSSKVQDFSARIQKSMADYSWMENRYKALEARYNGTFVAMAGRQQQQQQSPPPQQQPQQRQYRR